jgi:POT family proton-dependent oligopeptide transporter
MEKILNLSHSKETYFYGLSTLLERASYYGIRTTVILYMISESINMGREEALSLYGWMALLLIFSRVIGAALGDLVIGNRKSAIIGGIIQTLGAFSFCIPSITGIYIGLSLIVLGNGLYNPNITASFGKLYLNKTKLLDAGFTLFFLAINIGAFLGVSLIGYCGEIYGWNWGFVLSGTLMLLSILPILFSTEKNYQGNSNNSLPLNHKVIIVSALLAFVALFWVIYNISKTRMVHLQFEFSQIQELNIPQYSWGLFDSMFILPVSILAIVLWSYFYSNQFFKLTFGFIFGAIAYGILFLIPEIPTEQHIVLLFVSLFFLALSEVHLSPIIHSVLTQYANPKYLAIFISLSFILTRSFAFLASFFNEGLIEDSLFAIKFGMIAMIIISIGLVIFLLKNKK